MTRVAVGIFVIFFLRPPVLIHRLVFLCFTDRHKLSSLDVVECSEMNHWVFDNAVEGVNI